MGLWSIFCWLAYGIIVGSISRKIHPGDDPEGFLPTMGIGISGSFLGGGVNFLLGWGTSPFQSSGLIMGILGGVITCALYRWYKSQGDSILK
jgi:uncharacterized membrane protein YeaQ/YmgE (transglycosylase-associated protein family)